MKNLAEILMPYKTIAIAGMAKNVGKTTTLNHMIQGFASNGITLGLTSIGLDGEETDQVTATPKPRIFVPSSTIIATAEKLLTKRELGINDAARKILSVMDGISTPLGRIVVAHTLSGGYVMLAGPSMVSQIADVAQTLQNMGATKVIVDGAVGRKSLAVPHVAEAVVLATGAALSSSMDEVITQTKHTAELFNLPFVGAALCRPPSDDETHIQGAVTEKKLDNLRGKHIIAEDPSKILISPKALAKLRLSGGSISVKNRSNLVAITINPTSPYGMGFDPVLFLERMQQSVDIPVYNIGGALC
ncbi:MAG: hypothetical protein FWE34_05325 [Defluviitaleaceae bacterium]|nr:hypothetical protein [Defluviitaleaceae bacterium]